MPEFGAIILAAGLSRRMGDQNKLLVDIEGTPMIRRSVQPYVDVCDGDIVVVTGYDAQNVRAALQGLPLRFVYNAHFELGQKTSVATGLAAISGANHYFVGLGDQPFLTSADLLDLAAHVRDDKITVAEVAGQRGNPLVIPDSLTTSLLADRENPGCQKFTRSNPDKVNHVHVASQAFVHDLDTPEAIKALQIKRETLVCAP